MAKLRQSHYLERITSTVYPPGQAAVSVDEQVSVERVSPDYVLVYRPNAARPVGGVRREASGRRTYVFVPLDMDGRRVALGTGLQRQAVACLLAAFPAAEPA